MKTIEPKRLTPGYMKAIRDQVESSRELMDDKVARWSADRGEIHNIADLGIEWADELFGHIAALEAELRLFVPEEFPPEAAEKPIVKMAGLDGNAYFIMAKVQEVLRDFGCSKEEILEYVKEAKAGDYDHMIQASMKRVDFQ